LLLFENVLLAGGDCYPMSILVTSPWRGAGLRFGVLASALAAFALSTAPAQAQVFNAATDFSVTNGNPNTAPSGATWVYGETLGPTGAFTTYVNTSAVAGFNIWIGTSPVQSTPFIGRNNSGSTTLGTLPGQLAIHPGPNNRYSVLQFIAPYVGSFSVNSQFFAGDSGETNALIYLNGQSVAPLFNTATTSNNPSYSSVLALSTGDILSFSVGPGVGTTNFQNDTTPINVVITGTPVSGGASAPEPGTLALLLPAGMGLIGLVSRRRK
jgi:hypothetical protein